MKCNSPVLTTVAVDISDWLLGSELVEMDSVLTVNALPVEDAVEDVDIELSDVPVCRNCVVTTPALLVSVLPSDRYDAEGVTVPVLELSVTLVNELGVDTLPEVRVDSNVPASTVEAPVVDSVNPGSVLSAVAVGLDVCDIVLPLEISVDVCCITVVVVSVAVAVLPMELSLVSVGSEVIFTASGVPDGTLDDAVPVLCVSIDPVLVSILVGVVPSLATEALVLVVSDEVALVTYSSVYVVPDEPKN